MIGLAVKLWATSLVYLVTVGVPFAMSIDPAGLPRWLRVNLRLAVGLFGVTGVFMALTMIWG